MRRKSIKFALAAAAVLALVVVLIARNRDKRFEVFVSELDSVMDKVVSVIDANPTAAGVVKAREILGAEKDGLKAKLTELNALTVAQAGSEGLTQVDECLGRSSAKMNNLFKDELSRRQRELDQLRKRAKESALTVDLEAVEKAQEENRQFREAMKELLNDYKSIVN